MALTFTRRGSSDTLGELMKRMTLAMAQACGESVSIKEVMEEYYVD